MPATEHTVTTRLMAPVITVTQNFVVLSPGCWLTMDDAGPGLA
jgi:hypothetical protein